MKSLLMILMFQLKPRSTVSCIGPGITDSLLILKKTKIMYIKSHRTSVSNVDCRSDYFDVDCDTKVQVTDNLKLLGVVIDDKLSFDHHVHHVSNCLNPLIGSIFRKSSQLNNKLNKILYANVVMAKLNYAVRIWYPILI